MEPKQRALKLQKFNGFPAWAGAVHSEPSSPLRRGAAVQPAARELGLVLISCGVCCSPCEPSSDDKAYFLDVTLKNSEERKHKIQEG